jgi:hypothetical protein
VLIYDSLSSTSSFYSKIVSDTKDTTGKENMQLYIDNFISRKNLIEVNNLLEKYDSDFLGYDNLEQVINTILDSKYKPYWKNQEDVLKLQEKYSEIKEIRDQGNIGSLDNTSIKNKIEQIKYLSLNILDEGYIELEESTSNAYYYAVAGIIIVLIALLIYFGVKKSSKKKKKSSKKKEIDIFNKDEISPFDN